MSRVSLCGFIDCWLCGFTIVSDVESESSKRDPQSDLTSRYLQSVPNAFVTRPTFASIAMAAGWAGARCFCSCGPAGQGLVRGRPCGLRHNFFGSENSPRKKLSEVFQKIFRSVSEACRNFTKPGLYETLEQFPFPRSVSEHFQRISPGAQKCFFRGRNFPFPEEVRPSFLGIPVWLPHGFSM